MRGYKEALLRTHEDDTVISRGFTGKTLRAVRNEWTQHIEEHPEELAKFPEQMARAVQANALAPRRRRELRRRSRRRSATRPGQGVGAMHELVPAGDLVRRIVDEAEHALARAGRDRRGVTARRLLVIGGDAGGMTAASEACRRSTPDELEIVAFERGDYTSYSARAGLPYSRRRPGLTMPTQLIARTPESTAATGSTSACAHEVIAHRPRAPVGHRPRCRLGPRASRAVRRARHRDRRNAVAAAPARCRRRGRVRRPDDRRRHRVARTLDASRRATPNGHVVVVGGGYIGLEMAEALQPAGSGGHGRRGRRAADVDARSRHGRARSRRDSRSRHHAAHRYAGRARSMPTPTAASARS